MASNYQLTFNFDPRKRYTIEEIKLIIAAAPTTRDRLLIRWLFETGRRISELIGQREIDLKIYKKKKVKKTEETEGTENEVEEKYFDTGRTRPKKLSAPGLRVKDLRPELGEAYFHLLKKKRKQLIAQPVSERLMNDTLEYINRVNLGEEERIFSLKRNSWFRRFKHICKLANVDYRGVHATRHSFALLFKDHMEDPLVDIYSLQELLGHANVGTTMVYLKHGNRDAKKILKKMEF